MTKALVSAVCVLLTASLGFGQVYRTARTNAQPDPKLPVKGGPVQPPVEVVQPSPVIVEPATSLAYQLAPTPNVWANAEYMLMWHKSMPTQPILTVGDATNPQGGGLGIAGTVILFGGAPIDFNASSGFRLTFGGWGGPEGLVGFESRGFLLERVSQGANFTFTEAPAATAMGVPIFDVLGGLETAIPLSFPTALGAGVTGTAAVLANTRFGGGEANGLISFVRSLGFNFHGIVGFRYADLNESFRFDTSSTTVDLFAGSVFFVGLPFDATIRTTDSFETRNQFYGGQIGGRADLQLRRLSFSLSGKLAFGTTHQILDIAGSSTMVPFAGAPQAAPGGLLAAPSNSGHFTQNRFALMPETEAKVGFNLTERLRGFFGYNLMYISNVIRPVDQIDHNVDRQQLPTDPLYLAGAVVTRPAVLGVTTDYWAQGLTFGFEFSY